MRSPCAMLPVCASILPSPSAPMSGLQPGRSALAEPVERQASPRSVINCPRWKELCVSRPTLQLKSCRGRKPDRRTRASRQTGENGKAKHDQRHQGGEGIARQAEDCGRANPAERCRSAGLHVERSRFPASAGVFERPPRMIGIARSHASAGKDEVGVRCEVGKQMRRRARDRRRRAPFPRSGRTVAT